MAQSGPQNGAPWAALSCFQLLSLSTEKGQVPFGASVGVVSFFTTLETAEREDKKQKDNTVFKCSFQLRQHPPNTRLGTGTLKFSVVVSSKYKGKGATEGTVVQKLQSTCRMGGRALQLEDELSTQYMGPAHRRALTVGGRKEKPMAPESPTCLGIKPLCMPDQSLTCEAPFWDFLEMGGNTEKPPGSSPNAGRDSLLWTLSVGCTQIFPPGSCTSA